MNQMESDPVTVIENLEELDMNEGDEDWDGPGRNLNTDIHPTPVNDAINGQTIEAHSQSTGSNYISLKVRHIHVPQPQPAVYSQLGEQTATAAEVNERDQQNDIVEITPHFYYNLP